jgi:hypothetical protein
MNFTKRALIITLVLAVAQSGAEAANHTPMLKVAIDPSGTAKVVETTSTDPSNETGDEASGSLSRSPPVSTVATCRISNPPSADAARELIIQVAKREQFDANLLTAVAQIESDFDMDAVSQKGAIGLMQLMPVTAARFGVNPCNTTDNIIGGIRYLEYLQSRYQNPLYVLAAYNAGEDAVDRNRGIPPFPETVAYVAAVLDAAYAWSAPGLHTTNKSEQSYPKAKPIEQANAWSQGFVMHVTSTENR